MSEASTAPAAVKPRLGFLGLGWIGRHRLQAIVESGVAEIAALADVDPAAVEAAGSVAPGARHARDLEGLLEARLDGLVIATPSALHGRQSVQALEHGCAVFCQKPLGRDAREVQAVLAAARASDRLLDVDLSYRHTTGMQRARELVSSGELGSVYAVDLVFHNAYGPDKPWFYDARESGGGALMDLGTHLVDLALWVLDFPELRSVSSSLFVEGQPLRSAGPSAGTRVEDYATALLTLDRDVSVRLACSWKLHAGRDCAIEATFVGTRGAVSFRNVGGSFYDFETEIFRGTSRQTLASGPDAWGGRAAVAWARQLARSPAFDPACEHVRAVSDVLDAIYAAASAPPARSKHRP